MEDHFRGWIIRVASTGDDARRRVHPVVRDRRDHGDQLHGRDSNLLSHGDGTDRDLRPTAHRLGDAAGLAGKLDAGLRTEAKRADVTIKALFAQTQAELDGADVAGISEDLRDGEKTESFVI